MAREDISRMAREAGFVGFDGENGSLRRFAALVRADEREACAKVCEDNADDLSEGDWDSACINCADHIRARGNT
jgi:hypothetical protein